MNSLNHFAIGDSMHKEEFLELCINSENMDKQDFQHSQYYLDEGDYHPKTGIKLSSVGKGKNVLQPGCSLARSSRDTSVSHSSDAEEEPEQSNELVEDTFELTPGTRVASVGVNETSDMRGSSGSSA
jgi:hypothetical protein